MEKPLWPLCQKHVSVGHLPKIPSKNPTLGLRVDVLEPQSTEKQLRLSLCGSWR